MTLGLVLTALALGLRHGVDWDHIAAIADLTGAAPDRRRGLRLSMLYAGGHAVVVFALGTLAIVAGAAIPQGLNRWMGRVVGATLIWLGGWVLFELARHGREFRLRSRWMLVLDGTFGGLRRVAHRAGRRSITVNHEHGHGHDGLRVDDPSVGHGHAIAVHDHHHLGSTAEAEMNRDRSPAAVAGGVGGGRIRRWPTHHHHRHRHVLSLPERFDAGSGTSATGIGMLHGIGVESPTQIAVFVASTSVVGTGTGLAILGAWCLGLLMANAGLAVLAGSGLMEAERNFRLYAVVAVVVAIGSIAMGVFYLLGLDVLPAIGG